MVCPGALARKNRLRHGRREPRSPPLRAENPCVTKSGEPRGRLLVSTHGGGRVRVVAKREPDEHRPVLRPEGAVGLAVFRPPSAVRVTPGPAETGGDVLRRGLVRGSVGARPKREEGVVEKHHNRSTGKRGALGNFGQPVGPRDHPRGCPKVLCPRHRRRRGKLKRAERPRVGKRPGASDGDPSRMVFGIRALHVSSFLHRFTRNGPREVPTEEVSGTQGQNRSDRWGRAGLALRKVCAFPVKRDSRGGGEYACRSRRRGRRA